MKLSGKVALITGAGLGIGAAVASRFVAEGARVCINGRRQDRLDQVARSLPAGSVITCAGDVSRDKDVEIMVKATLGFGGRLDILVNNAGIHPAGSVTDLDPGAWRQTLEVDLTGPFLLMKAAIPHMVRVGGGSIINVASLAGLRCIPGQPAYCAAKAGLIMLTQQVAMEYGPQKIRSNVICPGGVRTETVEKSIGGLAEKLGTDNDGVFARLSSNVPLRRVAVPDEISGICSYLASDESSFMTGSVIVIDGGAAVVDVSGIVATNAGLKAVSM
jgi:meso-butanediol dehydrogenase / (S,S)-butanediol dehydrogenase / diacetyl reductase